MEIEFIKAEPKAKLIAFTPKGFDLAIASARTCYSPELIELNSITEGQRERIGKMIYEAGHHTPFQQAYYVFGLENVSRQFVWSFLHSHPFFNSDQSSQRYNVLDKAKVIVPEMNSEQEKKFIKAVMNAWNAYNELSRKLFEEVLPSAKAIGKIKNQSEKKILSEAEKKAVEWARYVLPISASTCLYHAVSGITLQRYIKMMNANECSEEAKKIIIQMIEEVKKYDSDFIEKIENNSFEKKEVIEEKIIELNSKEFIKEFDDFLENNVSKLRSSTSDELKVLSESIRCVLGLTEKQLSNEKAISLLLNPKENPYLLETLNCWTHSPLMRALFNVNYVFYTKISHAADSQNQRHRGTPAVRPILSKVISSNPDFIVPQVMNRNKELTDLYVKTCNDLWITRNELIDSGLNSEKANYLLPNSTSIRLIESGSLIHWLHKWRMRTCFNAQAEIWRASMQQLSQINPEISKFIGPACFTRKGIVKEKELEGPCPEGAHWCGVKTWINYPKIKRIW
jgi:flavin-dependent thymidylate synthase